MSFITPLAVSFLISGLAVAVTDLAARWVHDLEFLPAGLGLAWYFWYLGPLILALFAIFPLAVVAVFWGVNKVGKQKVGGADYIALGVFGLWPNLGVLAMVGALAVGFVGSRWQVRGRSLGLGLLSRGGRGMPWAGLMGLAAAFLAAAVLVG